jgi:hypothetical protein
MMLYNLFIGMFAAVWAVIALVAICESKKK